MMVIRITIRIHEFLTSLILYLCEIAAVILRDQLP